MKRSWDEKANWKKKIISAFGVFFSILSKECRIKGEQPPANTYTWSSVHPKKEYSASLNSEMEIELDNY